MIYDDQDQLKYLLEDCILKQDTSLQILLEWITFNSQDGVKSTSAGGLNYQLFSTQPER